MVSAVTRPHTASPCPYNTQQNLTLPLRYITLLGTSIAGPRSTLRSLRFSALRFGTANQHYTLPFHCNTFMASPCHTLPLLGYAKRYNAMPSPRRTLLNFTLPLLDYTQHFHCTAETCNTVTLLCFTLLCLCSASRCFAELFRRVALRRHTRPLLHSTVRLCAVAPQYITILCYAFASLRLLSALAFQHFLDTVYFAFRILDFLDVDYLIAPLTCISPLS